MSHRIVTMPAHAQEPQATQQILLPSPSSTNQPPSERIHLLNPFDLLLAEFRQEATATRLCLEAIPEQDFSWAPHPRSMTMGQLASHIADNPTWIESILFSPGIDMDPDTCKPWVAGTKAELLLVFDKNVKHATDLLTQANPAVLGDMWTMKLRGKDLFSMPKGATLRSFVFSHLIHHRGQLTVYLRLRDVAVPQVYGPTADHPM
jgi:uncharacterized damage-inducible protein DinB